MKTNIKTIYLVLFLLTSIFVSCQKVEIKTDVPPCIEEEITAYAKSNLPCESGKSVYQYLLNDRFVYVFNPGNCGADMMAEVYDENCIRICALGGIAGNLICEDVNFWEEATDETIIWED